MRIKKKEYQHPPQNYPHLSHSNWFKDLGNDSNQADQNHAIGI